MGSEAKFEVPVRYTAIQLEAMREQIVRFLMVDIDSYNPAELKEDVERRLLTAVAVGNTEVDLAEAADAAAIARNERIEAARAEKAKMQAECSHAFQKAYYSPDRLECSKCGVSGKAPEAKDKKK